MICISVFGTEPVGHPVFDVHLPLNLPLCGVIFSECGSYRIICTMCGLDDAGRPMTKTRI